MATNLLFCFFIINFLGALVHSELTSVVQTDNGPVQGEIVKTVRRSVEYSSFRGIPYGQPPIGHLRFKPPQKAKPWQKTLQATSEATPCPQIFGPLGFLGKEDCLNLNVYTPKKNFTDCHNGKLLPVMVWIYGGGFAYGYSNRTVYGPDYLIENDVIVVAMNYRLGILGFLALNLEGATGNAALKDQVLALKWVQRNIRAFGGDPNSVTIFGQSAGAAAVDYLILSEQSRGLFHRSITMSGGSLCHWAYDTSSQAESKAFILARKLGITTTDKRELLSALYNQSAENLVRAAENIADDIPFKPTVEDEKIAGASALLTECSINKYKTGRFNQLPHMRGFMAEELLYFWNDKTGLNDSVIYALKRLRAVKNLSPDLMPFVSDLTRIANMTVAEMTDDDIKDVVYKTSTVIYSIPIDLTRKLMTQYGHAPVYYYRDSFTSNESLHKIFTESKRTGPAHADDIAYIWYVSIAPNLPTDPNDPFVITQDRVSRMWTNFAKYSNPTPSGKSDTLLNISWPVAGSAGSYLEINTDLSVHEQVIDSTAQRIEEAFESVLPEQQECTKTK